MHKIVFLDRASIAPQVRLRRPDFLHAWTEYERTAPGVVGERLAGGRAGNRFRPHRRSRIEDTES